jgi:putative ABC transport system substrate-binding protein
MSAWTPLIAFSQSVLREPRLCFLTFDPPAARTTKFAEFFDALRGLGLIDGETIAIDWMSADGDGSRYPDRAADCLSRKAAVIVTKTTPATQAAKAATTTVPIVMLGISDPVANGMVASLARPGGNVTGTAVMQSESVTKRLELLSELIPGLSRVLLLVYPADPISGPQIKALKDAARLVNVTLLIHEVRTAGDIPAGYDYGVAMGAQAVLTAVTSIFTVERARLIELSAKFRLPAVVWRSALSLAVAGRPERWLHSRRDGQPGRSSGKSRFQDVANDSASGGCGTVWRGCGCAAWSRTTAICVSSTVSISTLATGSSSSSSARPAAARARCCG